MSEFVLTVDTSGANLKDSPLLLAEFLRRVADSMEDVTMSETGQYRRQTVCRGSLSGKWEWTA